MSDDATYEQALPDSYPTPLRGVWGRAWGAAHGVAMDLVLGAAKAAAKLGFIINTSTDTYPYHLADSGFEGLPGESPASVVERVRTVFNLWKLAGTRPGIVLALSQLAITGYTLRTTRDWLPGLPPDRRADLWARYWVLLFTHTWTATTWGSGTWGDATWGSSATVGEVTRVVRFLRRQSNARELGYVRLYFGGSLAHTWGGSTWGGTTWGPAGGFTFIDWRVS